MGDRVMFEAMVFGELCRCEVLGLRLRDLDGAQQGSEGTICVKL